MFFSMVCSECARARIARMNDHYDRDYAARARDLRFYLVSHAKGRKQKLLRKQQLLFSGYACSGVWSLQSN